MRTIPVRRLLAAAGLVAVLLVAVLPYGSGRLWGAPAPPPRVPAGAPTWRGLPVYPNGELVGSAWHTPDGEEQIRAWLDHTWHGRGTFERIPPGALDEGFSYSVSYQGVPYVYEVYEALPYVRDGPHDIDLREGRSPWGPAFDCKRC